MSAWEVRADLDGARARAWDNGYADGVADARDGYDPVLNDDDGELYLSGYRQGHADESDGATEDRP